MNTLLRGPVTAPVQFYPDFLSPADKQDWLTQSRALAWKRGELTMYGKKIPVPREEALFGDDLRYEYRGTVLKAEPWPDFLLEARDRIQAVCGLAFHFAVGNRYVTGKDSIGWHSDSFPQIGTRPRDCLAQPGKYPAV